MPPLLLVRSCLLEIGQRRKCEYGITGKAMGLLLGYAWPGNIRELKNVVESLCAINRKTKTVTAESIEWAIAGLSTGGNEAHDYSSAKNEFEKNYYIELLTKNNGNISASAHEANVDRPNFSRKLRALGITAAHYRDTSHHTGKRTSGK